jgi:hypothetical protein
LRSLIAESEAPAGFSLGPITSRQRACVRWFWIASDQPLGGRFDAIHVDPAGQLFYHRELRAQLRLVRFDARSLRPQNRHGLGPAVVLRLPDGIAVELHATALGACQC